jgi:hypothetical protein
MAEKKEPLEGDEFLTCEDGVTIALNIAEVNEETSDGQWTVTDDSGTMYTVEWDAIEGMWVDIDAEFPSVEVEEEEDPDAQPE